MKCVLSLAVSAMFASGGSMAQPSIEFLPAGYILTDLALKGVAGAGNVLGDGSFETFRWTPSGGIQRLGLATVPVIGRGAGTPDISYDGTRVSASILSSDSMLTQGVWDIVTGWTEIMPPAPQSGVVLDETYGTAWGLSGDGLVVTGFHWGTVGAAIRARASKWSVSTGVISLPQDNERSARVNAANFDGSVVAGWEERVDGVWRPTAWRGTTKLTLQDSPAFCEAGAISADGSVIVGNAYDEPTGLRSAARWVWNGSSYDLTILGALPMTLPVGQAVLGSVSDDGTIAVGFNTYTQNPGGPRDALVWTAEQGLMKGVDFIASLGLLSQIPAGMVVIDMPAISPDGGAIAAIGLQTLTGSLHSFVITLASSANCPGDTNGDSVVNFSDLNTVLAEFGLSGSGLRGDLNDDGVVNFTDLNEVLANFGASCR